MSEKLPAATVLGACATYSQTAPRGSRLELATPVNALRSPEVSPTVRSRFEYLYEVPIGSKFYRTNGRWVHT